MYILLVDDSAIIIKISKSLLVREGHQVGIAENGAIAIRKLQDQWELQLVRRIRGKQYPFTIWDYIMKVLTSTIDRSLHM
jgi:CheY-like chemotaxis protein